MTGIDAIQPRIAGLQSLIDSVSPGLTTTVDDAATSTSASSAGVEFEAALAAAVGASGVGTTNASASSAGLASDGSPLVAGLTLEEFQASEVASGTGLDLLQRAMGQLGVPYVWGGATPSGFDCSGLVQYVFGQMGITVPRVVREQMTIGTEVASLEQAQPGDLIVTRNGGHIGIYVGGDQMLHAPQPGDSVKIGTIYGDIVTIRRVVPTGEVIAAAGGSTLSTQDVMALLNSFAGSGLSGSLGGSLSGSLGGSLGSGDSLDALSSGLLNSGLLNTGALNSGLLGLTGAADTASSGSFDTSSATALAQLAAQLGAIS